jgi:PAS domain S-box-containing protein
MAADDPIAMNEHLKRDGCDIVITDYWLGWSDGLSILQRVRERWPRSRVIMLTGNGGEEVVAGAFKYGLYHYLLKPDGFDELAVVTGAAMESKRREDFNELMATIVNSIPGGIHCVDAAGKITAINAAARRMYGYAEAEIVASSSEMLLPVGQRDEIRRLHQRALDGEIVARFPMLQVRIDGAEIPVLMTILPMRHGGEAIANVAFIATAIGKTAREAGIASARNGSHPPRHVSASALTVH